MKALVVAIVPIIFLFSVGTFGQQQAYSKIKIDIRDKNIRELLSEGICLENAVVKKGATITGEFSAYEIEQIRKHGFAYDVLIPDMTKYYTERNAISKNLKSIQSRCGGTIAGYPTPSHFKLGSMGGFLTYQELLAELDSMALLFPNLITAKQPIDSLTTIEGRPIYRVKISDNPDVNESEPAVLYAALHHAREPASMQQLIFFMYYLLENYGVNPEVTCLVDNLEMYFIPCVNPDGYFYNQTTNPAGGGLWRKNRRNNGDGSYGVDLNRNYEYEWGYDDYGSSSVGSSETYRGASAFSEPETRAIKQFCESHRFKLALNCHTYGGYLVVPYGYAENHLTPDSSLYDAFSQLLTFQNHYLYGTANQTVGYIENGDSDDWMYGEQSTKPKIIALTTEAGEPSDGFWPQRERIVAICKAAIGMDLYLARLALKYALLSDCTSKIFTQQNAYFKYSLKCLGLDNPASFTASIVPVGNQVQSTGSPKTYTMRSLDTIMDSIQVTLSPSVRNGETITFSTSIDNGSFTEYDTITKIFGQPQILVQDAGTTTNSWTGSGWGITTAAYHSPPSCITDSPDMDYPSNSNKSITLADSIDLTDAVYAEADFWAKWEIEKGHDYTTFEASSDGGTTWQPLCGKYTSAGSSLQDDGQPIYDGNQYSWVKEEVTLQDFIGHSVKFRFTIVSNSSSEFDGFYFDDFSVFKILRNPSNRISESYFLSRPVPNPSGSVVSFMFSSPDSRSPIHIVVYNFLGKKVRTKLLPGNKGVVNIDIASLPHGIYYCAMESDGKKHVVHKLVRM